jgi:hypothetical protein
MSDATSDTRSSSISLEEDSLPNVEFDRLIQLSSHDLNAMGKIEIGSIPFSTLENLYLESISRHLKGDIAKKAALCRIAAIGGYPIAYSEYANMLFAGRGVKIDPREALVWYLKSVQNGNEESITFLYRLLKEDTIFADFNVTDISEQTALMSSIEDAYGKLESRWEQEG